MKLRNSTDIPVLPSNTTATAPSKPRSPDRVSLSGGGVQAALEAAQSSRADRLDSIARSVRDGSYRPDPARIANALVHDADLAAHLRERLASAE